ncbi:helix-turn-helix transcriptional regulator [Paenibacillus flagellatus]|uniref:AraC family transcriptional regulator n=1 Tax=Paenibacillus flagellatus TaxID=2211139 RepID=A0A2V5K3X3_9BACL|nr:AraC family transcriptional regulator [Paenibacillus flagellatus]PYI53948.1 AraC family transcriptional regulator [Paenibacillus flagellatus]
MQLPSSFGFVTGDDTPFMTLDSIGWQTADSDRYSYSGTERGDRGHVIFQYTLSGEGRIELDSTTYRLPAETGFLVKVPSRHRYYYDKASKRPWEFLWLNVKGEDAERLWDRIVAHKGPIVALAPDSPPIARLWRMFRAVADEGVSDKYALSALVYDWALTMLRPETGAPAPTRHDNPIVGKAKRLMKERRAEPLTLGDVAAHCGVTGHHLCKLFRNLGQGSPLEYLRRRRVEAAVSLLRATDLPVAEIGRRCGFESPSYFGKVFRHYLGQSPGDYRVNRKEWPFDAVFLNE